MQILAFPCNQFGSQEPGSPQDIEDFARGKYGVQFPILEKIEVNGQNTNPVYSFLRTNSILFDAKKKTAKEIPWNFSKFLLNSSGQVVQYYEPKVFPDAIIPDIQKQLWAIGLTVGKWIPESVKMLFSKDIEIWKHCSKNCGAKAWLRVKMSFGLIFWQSIKFSI